MYYAHERRVIAYKYRHINYIFIKLPKIRRHIMIVKENNFYMMYNIVHCK